MRDLSAIKRSNDSQQADYVSRRFAVYSRDGKAWLNLLGHKLNRPSDLPLEYVVVVGRFQVPYQAITAGLRLPFPESSVCIYGDDQNSVALIVLVNNANIAARIAETHGQTEFYTRNGEVIQVRCLA